MFKILVCEEFVGQNIQNLFINSEYDIDIDIVYSANEIFEKTYIKNYDLYVVNFFFYHTIEELKSFEDETITIFVDEYYDIYHIKKAFEIGDSYIIKPLNLEELKIRIAYYYKKLYSKKMSILTYKNLFFHTKTKQLYKNSTKIKLSPNDAILVELFLQSKNKPLMKYNLMDEINSSSDGALRVYISKLKKIGFNIEFDRGINSYILK